MEKELQVFSLHWSNLTIMYSLLHISQIEHTGTQIGIIYTKWNIMEVLQSAFI